MSVSKLRREHLRGALVPDSGATMSPKHVTDANLAAKDVRDLTSPDALAGFFAQLGYDTSRRAALTPEAIGLAGDAATAIRHIELLAEDAEGFFRVVFVQFRSLTAKSRGDLARVLGKSLHAKLKTAYSSWVDTRDDRALVDAIGGLADEFSKTREAAYRQPSLMRDDLRLICFDYVSS